MGPGEQRLWIVVGLADQRGLGVANQRPDLGLDLQVLLVELVFDAFFQEVLGGRRRVCSIAGLDIVIAVTHGFRGELLGTLFSD